MVVAYWPVVQSVGLVASAVAVAAFPVVDWLNVGKLVNPAAEPVEVRNTPARFAQSPSRDA